ncbi:MAG: helix-turn-helix transcriptional regulator [Acidimicrobiales bacterium]
MQINSMRDLAATVRGRRQDLGLSQVELAAKAGVSREWINAFEGGKTTVEFGLVIRVLDALGLCLDIVERGSGADARPSGSVNLDTLLDEYRD